MDGSSDEDVFSDKGLDVALPHAVPVVDPENLDVALPPAVPVVDSEKLVSRNLPCPAPHAMLDRSVLVSAKLFAVDMDGDGDVDVRSECNRSPDRAFVAIPPFLFNADGISFPEVDSRREDITDANGGSRYGLRRMVTWYEWLRKIANLLACGGRTWSCSSAFTGIGRAEIAATAINFVC